jgi:DNA repair exonuclease SbcCD ATPase subunit
MSDSLHCPLCSIPLDIRKSVKGKPYTVCDHCGMQMFIRKEAGISALKNLIANGEANVGLDAKRLKEKISSLERELGQKAADLESADQAQKQLSKISRQLQVAREELNESRRNATKLERGLTELEKAMLRTCPECKKEFRIREDLIETSWLDGSFQGFRCPSDECIGIAPPHLEEE